MPRSQPAPFGRSLPRSVLLLSFSALVACSLAAGPAETPAAPPTTPPPAGPALSTEGPVQTMEAFKVTADKAKASEGETAERTDVYNAEAINDSGAFGVDEFISQLPRSSNGSEVLVLIDGQPTYIDPASLPLNMIQSIEVSRDGSMPKYGAFANGQVINIRLKKDYRGGEFAGRYRGTFAGGGGQNNVRFSGGATLGKGRLFYTLERSESFALSSLDRSFSRHQNHLAQGGRDLRLSWGAPAVVQATSGPLAGFTDTLGQPTSVALVRERTLAHGAASLADFVPGDSSVTTAADQRRFDTAAFRDLTSPSNRWNGNLNFNRELAPRLNLSLTGTVNRTESDRRGPPPVSPASSATVVPAAYNPFGQDVQVGWVHREFGPTLTHSTAWTAQAGAKLDGRLGDSWSWNSGLAFRTGESRQTATDLDAAKLTAALANPDPARRYNPFADDSVGSVNASLYPELTLIRRREDSSHEGRFDFGAQGQLLELPAGPLLTSFRGGYTAQSQDRLSTPPSAGNPAETSQSQSSYNVSVSTTTPLIGAANAWEWTRRLELTLTGRSSGRDGEAAGHGGQVGVVWSPIPSVLFRSRYSYASSTPPKRVLAGSETLVGETFIDPARENEAVNNVRIFTRETSLARAETSETRTFGVTVEPTWLPGLRLGSSYDIRQRHDILADKLETQDIINNERGFPGRVQRAQATATDLALGRPGVITAVDLTPGNSGESETENIDFTLEYVLPWQKFGRFRLTGYGEHFIRSRYDIAPGVPYVHEGSSELNPPDWSFQSQASWNQKAWNASVRLRYTGTAEAQSAATLDTPATSTVDLNVGYRFIRPVWRTYGRGLRLTVGLENVFDRDPPFADTLSGFRGGSPLGRTYSFAAILPL